MHNLGQIQGFREGGARKFFKIEVLRNEISDILRSSQCAAMSHFLNTVNTRLVDIPLLHTLTIMDEIQIPGKSYGGFTGNDWK